MLSKGEEFKTVGLRLKEILGYRCVGSLALPWCLFEYKQADTREDGLCVISSPRSTHLLCLCREKLACELLLMQQTMEVMLHSLGVKEGEDLGDLRLPFAVAAHLSPDGCRFVALSPDENERGLRPCVCLTRIPWSNPDRILTGFAHIVVRFAFVRLFAHQKKKKKKNAY